MDREDIAELFSAFGPVSVRRMFSGFGLFAEDVCFSLFLRGELYLKADETTAPRFAAEGSKPFGYVQPKSGKAVTVNSFWRLPDRLYDDAEELAQWARQALAVAHRNAARKSKAAANKRRPARRRARMP